jgi:S-phase kinase-associated protein 1
MSTVNLIANDSSEPVSVPMSYIELSATLTNILQDVDDKTAITLPNVDQETLLRVVQYMEHYHENPGQTPPERDPEAIIESADGKPIDFEVPIVLDAWDAEFLGGINMSLQKLLVASDFLEMAHLKWIACRRVAKFICETTDEAELRRGLGVPDLDDDEAKAAEEAANDGRRRRRFTPEELAKVREENEWARPRKTENGATAS